MLFLTLAGMSLMWKMYLMPAVLGSEIFVIQDLTASCATAGEFWDNTTATCSKCSTCRNSEVLIQKCTAQSDTVCQCKSGWFAETGEQCRECRKCPAGSNVIAPCTSTTNTQCADCPTGKYRDDATNTCRVCSSCKPNEMVQRPCRALFNTECISSDIVHPQIEEAIRLSRLRIDSISALTGEKALRHTPIFPPWNTGDYTVPEFLYYLPSICIILVFGSWCLVKVLLQCRCCSPILFIRKRDQQPLTGSLTSSAGPSLQPHIFLPVNGVRTSEFSISIPTISGSVVSTTLPTQFWNAAQTANNLPENMRSNGQRSSVLL